MDSLDLSGVTVRYGDREALSGIDLRVEAGERVALIGPNGSGKTTLLRTLAGIMRPDAGEVRPAGGLSRREIARRVAFLPQNEFWEFPFLVEDVVRCGRYAFATALFGESEEDRAAIERAIAAVGLKDLRKRPVTELSGGERRRAVLARALAQETPIMLLDEPTTALDLEHRHAVLKALGEREGSVIFSTHDLDAAAGYARRVVVLDHGRLIADGSPQDVITEALLRDVFHVDARIIREGERIHVITEI